MDESDWLEEVDHTGDAGIRVFAGDVRTLFERAASGMFRLITDIEAVDPQNMRTVRVEGSDRADLLLRWLSELNFIHVTEHVLFSRFEIRAIDDTNLIADVWGERVDPKRHVVHTEIKAVTYHGLEIRRDRERLEARVIFDM